MAQLNDLIVTGKSRFLNSISGNITGTASNVTGTVAIANGGTGATTRLNAAKNLTNEAVATPGYIVGLTENWGKFGYTSIAQLKTTLGLGSNAYTSTAYLPLAGGTMTGNGAIYSNSIIPRSHELYQVGDPNNAFFANVATRTIYTTDIRCLDVSNWGNAKNAIYVKSDDITFQNYSGATDYYTWDGTNTSLKTAIASVVTYKDFTCTSASVPANSSKEFASVNVAKTGYTPIGFLKYNTGDGSITPVNLYLEGNNAILVLRNVSSAAKSVAPTFRILYMKTTS